MIQIQGATALVTGGQRGLGQAYVTELLNAGARKVYATARRPSPASDPRIVPLTLDVTDIDSVAQLAHDAADVDIVINNAGTTVRGPLSTADLNDVYDVFDTNVYGVVRVSQTMAPVLAANGGGVLVNVASALSWAAGAGAYGASKAAVWSITNSLRIELAAQGTQVVGVYLGYTDTDMTHGLEVVKNDPAQVARDTLAVVEHGGSEVLADRVTRELKQALSGPAEGLSFSVIDGETVLPSAHANAAHLIGGAA